jgi:hypothetical protein
MPVKKLFYIQPHPPAKNNYRFYIIEFKISLFVRDLKFTIEESFVLSNERDAASTALPARCDISRNGYACWANDYCLMYNTINKKGISSSHKFQFDPAN